MQMPTYPAASVNYKMQGKSESRTVTAGDVGNKFYIIEEGSALAEKSGADCAKRLNTPKPKLEKPMNSHTQSCKIAALQFALLLLQEVEPTYASKPCHHVVTTHRYVVVAADKAWVWKWAGFRSRA
eukprot:3241561-Amphidinium_carterae.1